MTKMTDKNTKAQILEAYNKLLQQLKDQNSSMHDPATEMATKKKSEILNSASTTVEQSVEDQITELQKTMQSVLVNLSGSFTDKVKEYSTVEEAIALKKEELKEIHDIEVEAFSLAALVNTHKELEENFNNESAEKREQLNKELQEIRKQIQQTRIEWQQEIKEAKEKFEKECQREKEEYEYDFNREKQKREDELNDTLIELRKEFYEEKEEQEKELSSLKKELETREENISKREEKMEHLESLIASMPEKEIQLKAEIEESIKAQYAKHAAIKENSIKREYESKETIYQNKIQLLEEQLRSKEQMVEELSNKLDAAYDKIQSVAIATTNRPMVEYRGSQSESK